MQYFLAGFMARKPIKKYKPYQYEPLRQNMRQALFEDYERNEQLTAGDVNSERLQTLSWCWCEKCVIQSSSRECVCCWEEINTDDLRGSAKCVTLAENFPNLCLNRHVLETAIAQERHKEGKSPGRKRPIPKKEFRYHAYKNYIYWVHRHELSKNVRYVIPSCVINSIRENFPNPHFEPYVGFREFMESL